MIDVPTAVPGAPIAMAGMPSSPPNCGTLLARWSHHDRIRTSGMRRARRRRLVVAGRLQLVGRGAAADRRRRRRRGRRRWQRGISSSELPGQPAPGSQEDLEVSVGDRVLFDYDSSVLDPAATQTLDRQAAWLKQYPDVIVTIEGHADERGTREYNLALGDRRAKAVKNYLVALGVSGDRLLTISYGEERPADPAHNEAAWAENRRAVTVGEHDRLMSGRLFRRDCRAAPGCDRCAAGGAAGGRPPPARAEVPALAGELRASEAEAARAAPDPARRRRSSRAAARAFEVRLGQLEQELRRLTGADREARVRPAQPRGPFEADRRSRTRLRSLERRRAGRRGPRPAPTGARPAPVRAAGVARTRRGGRPGADAAPGSRQTLGQIPQSAIARAAATRPGRRSPPPRRHRQLSRREQYDAAIELLQPATMPAPSAALQLSRR